MVFSQLATTTRPGGQKSLHILLPLDPPDVVSSEQLEFDFSDVFGPSPVQTSIELNAVSLHAYHSNDKAYDDPMVVFNRSHSLVGPTTCVSPSLRLSKLTLHETESSLELVESACGEADGEHYEPSVHETEGDHTGSEDGTTGSEEDTTETEEVKGVGLDDFEVLKLVGQGAFGKVFQVNRKGTSEIYAMKVMRKDKIMEMSHAEYMKAERDILTKLDNPFIIQLRYSFQTKYRLYLVLDFVNGGHLFFQLYHHGLFREDLARIYTAEIVSAVSHLHSNGIMHRDLKPENILLDADGHAMLTDFGLAKQFDGNTRSNSMCGTLEYMAPEIILAKGHDKAADWWSVGVLLFEMLTGKPPFVGNRQKVQQKILKDKIKLPGFLSSEAHSLLKGLLQKDPSRRLGSGPNGSDEIKKHKWFKPINWRKLDLREIEPSFRPNVSGQSCVANFEDCWTSKPLLDSPVSSPVFGDYNFPGFTYVRPTTFLQKPSPLH